MSPKDNVYPPYTPMASLGRELGVMFAFIGACLVTMVIYSLARRVHQKRTQAQDLTRRKAFHNNRAAQDMARKMFPPDMDMAAPRASGKAVVATPELREGVRVYEEMKVVDRYGGPLGRVELPVHGDGIGNGSGSVGKGIL